MEDNIQLARSPKMYRSIAKTISFKNNSLAKYINYPKVFDALEFLT